MSVKVAVQAAMPFRFYGWKRQPKDDRDLKFSVKAPRKLPTSIDLSAGMGPQLDQADLGSCGPNSSDELIVYDQKKEKRTVVAPSRLFIYYTTRQLMGAQYVREDSGVDNRTMLKALNKYGYCPESKWPYDTNKFTAKPSAALYTSALANCIKNYGAVQQTLAQMQAALVSGFPFLFGFTCFPGLESEATAVTGIVPTPKKNESEIGGHDVSFCGFNATGKALAGVVGKNKWPANTFKFRNHWVNGDGSPWGDGGYGYMPVDYATNANLAGDFWVINFAN